MIFLVTQVIFVCVLWQSCPILPLWNTMNMLFIHNIDVACKQYNVKNYSKHEIILLDTCLLYLYLRPYWVGQHLNNYHKNVTHISSAVSHDAQRYMDTLFPCPCLHQYCKYDNNEVVLHYYRFQKYDWIFYQTSCFAQFDFYIWGVSDEYHVMLTGKNA